MSALQGGGGGAQERPGWGQACVKEVRRHASLCDLVHWLGGQAAPDDGAAAPGLGEAGGAGRFIMHRVACGATLAHEGAPAHALYVVLAGSFKCVKTAEDGYEHVLRFVGRPSIIGFDGLADARYASSVVALEDSAVYVLPVAGLDALRRQSGAFDAALQHALSRELAHAAEMAEVMAPVTAEARLARFLVKLSSERRARGESPHRLLLRMSRRDIANHLGLAHETISRSFTALAEIGCLRVDNREIEIVDLQGLLRFARCTRGAVDDPPRHGATVRRGASRRVPPRPALATPVC